MALHIKPIVAAALVAAACVCFAFAFGPSAEMVQFCMVSCVLGYAAASDLRERVVPNECIALAVAVRLCYCLFSLAIGRMDPAGFAYYAASGFWLLLLFIVFGLAYERAARREGIGGGDVKLYAVAGLYLGFERAVIVVLLSCVIMLVVSAAKHIVPSPGSGRAAACQDAPDQTFPFAPAITLSFVAVALAAQLLA